MFSRRGKKYFPSHFLQKTVFLPSFPLFPPGIEGPFNNNSFFLPRPERSQAICIQVRQQKLSQKCLLNKKDNLWQVRSLFLHFFSLTSKKFNGNLLRAKKLVTSATSPHGARSATWSSYYSYNRRITTANVKNISRRANSLRKKRKREREKKKNNFSS